MTARNRSLVSGWSTITAAAAPRRGARRRCCFIADRELSRHFGEDAVFLDSKSVLPGTQFDESLLDAVQRCAVLLVVIGDRSFTTGADGRRLLDRRPDWVRR
jgi:hypothetical protein